MNNFLKGFFSLFDRMGWGSYSNALQNIYVLSPDMEIISLEKDMENSIISETVYVDGNKVIITTSKELLDQLRQ